MTTPYTYLIKHIPSNRVYYGVRYSKKCNPIDLWETYFTSSEEVKKLLSKDGKDAFHYEIRRTFNNKNDALKWERKVLRRIKAKDREIFINKWNGGPYRYAERKWMNDGNISHFVDKNACESFLEKGWSFGRIFPDDHKRKLSEAASKIDRTGDKNPSYGTILSDRSRQVMSTKSKAHTQRGDNPNAKQVLIDGIVYRCVKDACDALGISYKKCRQFIM